MHSTSILGQHGALITAIQINTAMLRLGNRIRLTRPEAELFLKITGIDPSGIRTVFDLRTYVFECKRHYWGTSHATRLLHRLIDLHLVRCIRGHSAGESPLLGQESLARLSRWNYRAQPSVADWPSDTNR